MIPDIDVRITGRAAYLTIVGELDHNNSDSFTDLVTHILDEHEGLADLHLDFGGLTSFDTAALAAVLLIHRRSSQAHITLHLDHRPDFVDRTLDLTGTRDHLTTALAAVYGTVLPATTTSAEHHSL